MLRLAGIRAGLERFTEFANILFLKLLSERDPEDGTWTELLNKRDDELPDYLNGFVINKFKRRYDSDVLSETQINGSALKQIVQELNPLHLQGVDEDLKGVAFEHFLSRTTAVNNDLGEYFTPRSVVRFMVQLLNPQFRDTIYDPFCGTGGFLIEAFRHLSQQTRPLSDAIRILHHESIYGRELTTTARVAKMNMILFGDGNSGVVQGDSLALHQEQPQHDCVLSNIPFSLDIDSDTLRILNANAKDADEACLLHCFNSVKRGGKGAIVLPEGLVVNREHAALWERIFADCLVRVIATLPRGTFAPYTDAGTNILYFTDKGERKTDWYYRVNINGDKAKGVTIDSDEFLFFHRNIDPPLGGDQCPDDVEVVRVKDGRNRTWSIAPGNNIVTLRTVASISNGSSITEAHASPGPFPVVAGGRVSAYTHNKSNADGGCFTVSKSGAYAGYAWWHEYPIWASDCMVVRSNDEDKFASMYLYLCFKSRQDEVYGRQQGTGQPHIYKQHIKEFPIPDIPLSEQWDYISEVSDMMRQRVDVEKQADEALDMAVAKIGGAYKTQNTRNAPKIYVADYQGASPKQVAKALLGYKPERK